MAPRKRRATANATSAFMRNATTTWATTTASNTSTNLSSGFTPLDTLDTYFDSQITDLFQRQLNTAWMSYARERQTHYKDACGQPQYQDIRKSKTEGYFGQGFPAFDEGLFDSGICWRRILIGSLRGLRLRSQHEYLNCPTCAWHSAKVVQTREKVSFFWFHVGVVPEKQDNVGREAPYLPLDDLVRLGSTSTRSAMMSLVDHSPALVSNETLPSEGLGVGLEPLSGQAELGIGPELSLDGEQWQEAKKVK
ncbi:hypothetical protein D9758_016932 [Tetrapyrgos nigripes]|uniref:Uncharacterized protein n=1 Tax=Tetrapyrgos nigripes TaxID=182062 RepID=A0A8H5C008_9AGAR|nr:hypothetical protein D9758_016932 [Tetrapyrgos nigripes]